MAAIAIKGLEVQFMSKLYSRDILAITVNFIRSNTDKTRQVVSSAYFLHEEGGSLPSKPVVKLAEHYQEKGLPLIVGCDANAHYMI